MTNDLIGDFDILAGRIKDEFLISGEVKSFAPYGNGHINTTYLLETDCFRYIVQRINDYVFKDVEKLMENIVNVIDHLGGKGLRHLTYVATKSGKSYAKIEGTDFDGFYRVYDFLEDTESFEIVTDAAVFERAGRALGKFHEAICDLPTDGFWETIPNFHDTEVRYQNFLNAVLADKAGRAECAAAEIAFVKDRKAYSSLLTSGIKDGSLALAVSHNDTKINNFLFDVGGDGESDVMIDLDTVMKGIPAYDFGDAIRAGCNTGAEDEADLSKVGFDIGLFEAFCEGFLPAMQLDERGKESLVQGAIVMTFECGMRFLSDFLDGDVYFKVRKENHNLIRARTQFKMVSDMEAVLSKMREIVFGEGF